MTPDAWGLVLAGGAGTRMAASDPDTPKPLVTVNGTPLVVLAARRLVRAGVERVTVAVAAGPRGDRVRAALDAPGALPAGKVEILVEESPLGTIGALAAFRGRGRTVLAVNGDLLSAIDLGAVLARHRDAAADVTIATHVESRRLEFGEVVTDAAGRVLAYREKPLVQVRISSGTYAFSPAAVARVRGGPTSLPDLVEEAIAGGLRVVDCPHDAAWLDVNDAATLARARALAAADPEAFGLHSATAPRPDDQRATTSA